MADYSQFFSGELKCISKLRVARIALAVQRYRLKYGELPDLLNNLVPEFLESVPLDPFDGEQLRYKKFDSGFAIYGIGENLIDDGGPIDTSNKLNTKDVIFILDK